MSLVELLVAVALSAVVLLAGTWLLLLLLRHSADQLGRPPALGGPEHVAIALLERDACRALDAPARAGGWQAEAGTLLLQLPRGELVVYHVEHERLLRTVAGRADRPQHTRLLLQDVLGADFSRRGSLFHLRLRRADGSARQRVVLGRNLGLDPPTDDEEGS